jgi:hypothetical protein
MAEKHGPGGVEAMVFFKRGYLTKKSTPFWRGKKFGVCAPEVRGISCEFV